MRRLRRLLTAPFVFALAGCLVLTGWALWSDGIFDGPVASQVRESSVYAAPGIDLDQQEAERVIGNRRLVVVMLEPGADLAQACDRIGTVADGNVGLILRPETGPDPVFDRYGCSLIPGHDDENFGKAFVADTMIANGVAGFVDRPLDALKVVAVNYDTLVKAGTVPDGPRSFSPSLPRYLAAAAAIAAVLLGTTTIYVFSYRAGRIAAAQRARREDATDSRSVLSAGAAGLAQQIIELDRRYTPRLSQSGAYQGRPRQGSFEFEYPRLAADYGKLLESIQRADARGGKATDDIAERIAALSQRATKIADKTE